MLQTSYKYITDGWDDAEIWWVGTDLEEDDRLFQSVMFQKESANVSTILLHADIKSLFIYNLINLLFYKKA
jgi:hypothetical protein